MDQEQTSHLNDPKTECSDVCPHLNWVFRLLVFAQFVLIALLMIAQPKSHPWHAWLISIVGAAFGLWAIFTMGRYTNISPRLKRNAILRVKGPYRLVRHPMYLAVMVFCSGYLIDEFTIYKLLIWFSLLVVLTCKMYYEEKILRDKFPEYQQYANRTKRIVPFVF